MVRGILVALLLIGPLSYSVAQTTSGSSPTASIRAISGQVARIICHSLNGLPARNGFGLIVGQRNGALYIAVPHDLVVDAIESRSKVGIVFRERPNLIVDGEVLSSASGFDKLAAVKSVPPAGLNSPIATAISSDQLVLGTKVWIIGGSKMWKIADHAGALGQLDAVAGRIRVSGLSAPTDSSGGAGVAESGIIGMVLEITDDNIYLLPIDRLTKVFAFWNLPVNLLIFSNSTVSRQEPTSTANLASARPTDYCSDLKSVIESSRLDFSDLMPKDLGTWGVPSKLGLHGWQNCSIFPEAGGKREFNCDFGKFSSAADYEEMAEKVAMDISSCLSPDLVMSQRRSRYENDSLEIDFETYPFGPRIELGANRSGHSLQIKIYP